MDIVSNIIIRLFYETDFLIGLIYRLWFILSEENNFGYKSQSSLQNWTYILLYSSDFCVFDIFGSGYDVLYWNDSNLSFFGPLGNSEGFGGWKI